MKFSLISDMHVDFPQPKTPYDKLEEQVVVAGDTSNGLLGAKFLNKLKNKGHKVFAIDGNHEHYSNLSQGRTQVQTENAFYSGLQQHRAIIADDNIMIVGVNGWYQVADEELWQGYMNDSFYSGLSADDVNMLAEGDAGFIGQMLSLHTGRAIVVTHTAPTLETLNPRFDGHYSNEWYWNPLMGEVLRKHAAKIAVWCHGHTHSKNEAIVHGVRVVCNPRGYPGENPDWEPLTIEV